MSRLKSNIYKALKYHNDYNAIRKGKIKQRVGRRMVGRITSRLMNKIFK